MNMDMDMDIIRERAYKIARRFGHSKYSKATFGLVQSSIRACMILSADGKIVEVNNFLDTLEKCADHDIDPTPLLNCSILVEKFKEITQKWNQQRNECEEREKSNDCEFLSFNEDIEFRKIFLLYLSGSDTIRNLIFNSYLEKKVKMLNDRELHNAVRRFYYKMGRYFPAAYQKSIINSLDAHSKWAGLAVTPNEFKRLNLLGSDRYHNIYNIDTRSKINAQLVFFYSKNEYYILVDSSCAGEFTSSGKRAKGLLKLKEQWIEEGVLRRTSGYYIFYDNAKVNSPSQAASIILGCNAGGPSRWINTKTQKSLKEELNDRLQRKMRSKLKSKKKKTMG